MPTVRTLSRLTTEIATEGLVLAVRGFSAARRVYDDLAARGEQVLAERRGTQPQAATPAPTPAPAHRRSPTFQLPKDVEREITKATPGATLAHDELPLADYDHLTLGSLRARLPKLDPVALVQLRDYERAHADRLPVVKLLENRLAKVGATYDISP